VREEDWERYKPKSFRDAAAVFGGSEPESGFRMQ
jgi:hypothetical protein